MTTEQFTYWLQGFAEINQEAPTEAQWKIIKDHLQLVFKKETPIYNPEETPNWLLGVKSTPSFPPRGNEVIC